MFVVFRKTNNCTEIMFKEQTWITRNVVLTSILSTAIVFGYNQSNGCWCATNDNFWYYDPICIPKNYDPTKAPIFGNFSVHTNIVLATRNSKYYNSLKHIDVHKMMLTFAPIIAVSWVDIRLMFCYQETKRLEKNRDRVMQVKSNMETEKIR